MGSDVAFLIKTLLSFGFRSYTPTIFFEKMALHISIELCFDKTRHNLNIAKPKVETKEISQFSDHDTEWLAAWYDIRANTISRVSLADGVLREGDISEVML